MKGVVRTVIICAYSSPHLSSSVLSSVSEMLEYGPFIVYFPLSYFFSYFKKYITVSLGTVYPFVPFEEREWCRVTSKKNHPKSNGDRVMKKPHFVFKQGYKITL